MKRARPLRLAALAAVLAVETLVLAQPAPTPEPPAAQPDSPPPPPPTDGGTAPEPPAEPPIADAAPTAPPPAATPPPAEPAAPRAPAAAPVEPEPYLRGGAPLYFLGAPNLFRASHFDWETDLSTNLLGGDPGQHRMIFSLFPRVAFLETRDHWAWVGIRIGWRFLLAHKEKPKLEPPFATFDDLALELGYAYTFVQRSDGLVVRAGPRASAAFPTSPDSSDAEIYTTTRLGLGVDVNLPLLRGDWLNGVFVRGDASWAHVFSRFENPGTDIARNRLSFLLGAWLNVWGDLSFGTGVGISQPFFDTVVEGSDCVPVANAPCPELAPQDNSGVGTYGTAFDVSLSYPVARMVWLSVGYDSVASSIDTGGDRRSLFASPFSEVYLSARVLLDQAYARTRTR